MEPLLRASLATLAALSVLGGLSSLFRQKDHPAWRFERIGLLLHHGMGVVVTVAIPIVSMLGGGDGRPLLLCIPGSLLILCVQEMGGNRIALLMAPLVAAGLLAEVLVLVHVVPALIAGPACAGIGAGSCAAGAVVCWLRRRTTDTPRVRALLASQAGALGVAAVAGLVGLIPTELGAGAWAVGVGAAGAIGTAARLQPQGAPGLRELVAGLVVFSMVLAAGAAAPFAVTATVMAALWASQVAVAVFALARATFDPVRPGFSAARAKSEPTSEAPLPGAQALAAMAPLLDDALLRRPGRPRVIARVPARRLLDAALDKAKSAQPVSKGRRDEMLRVDVIAADSDIDVDGDAADLAEALCAVLDNALRVRVQHPDVRVQVHMRGSPAAVTFEITDSLPDGTQPPAGGGIPDADAPFLNPRADVDRPGLGVSLARARILVERNGGKLLTRSSAEGSTVQVTMPRRIQKGAVGQA